MIVKGLALCTSLFLAAASTVAIAQSDADQLRKDILAWPALSVANEATNPDGDVLTPRHGVGFVGQWQDQRQLFEERRRLTKNLEKFVAFNPNADVLFAGSAVQGRSLQSGILSAIGAGRSVQTCTVTDLAGAGPTARFSAAVVPSLENITLAVTAILGQELAPQQPAKMSYSEATFNSVEEGVLRLGASYSWLSGSVSGSFEQHKADARSRIMVRFVQSYFTVSCAAPSNPDPLAFFAPDTNFAALRNHMGPDNPPAYIASVTYGRELWMLIESSHSEKEVKAMLDAAVSTGAVNGKMSFSSADRAVVSDSNIQVLVLGGGGKPGVGIITGNPAQLQAYLEAGANFSAASPGVPISYTVRYLKNNEVARVSSSTDYTIKTDAPAPKPVPLTAVTAEWLTTADDKDWDTQATIQVFDKAGKAVASIACCNKDRSQDNWPSGHSEIRNLTIIGRTTNVDLATGHFSAGRKPVGHDDWDYKVSVTLSFADGSARALNCTGRNSCSASW